MQIACVTAVPVIMLPVEFVRSSNPEQQILEVCPPPLKNMAGRLTTNPKKLRYSYEVGLETGLQAIENWNAMK